MNRAVVRADLATKPYAKCHRVVTVSFEARGKFENRRFGRQIDHGSSRDTNRIEYE
jgi:hypothetical protein